MNQTYRAIACLILVLLSCVSLGANGGCNGDVAGEVAAITGGWVGDVVAVVATKFLETIWGTGAAAEDTSHGAGPLHDHEH